MLIALFKFLKHDDDNYKTLLAFNSEYYPLSISHCIILSIYLLILISSLDSVRTF